MKTCCKVSLVQKAKFKFFVVFFGKVGKGPEFWTNVISGTLLSLVLAGFYGTVNGVV